MKVRFYRYSETIPLTRDQIAQRQYSQRLREVLGDRPPDVEVSTDAAPQQVPAGPLRALFLLLKKFLRLGKVKVG